MSRTPLLNIGELIDDPDFCQDFIVLRREGTWNLGRFTTTETEINAYGIIDPQPTKEMQFNPDGVLLRGLIKVYTHMELYTTQKVNNEDGKSYNSDIVIWHDNHYIIIEEDNYSDYGYRGYTCQLKDAAGVNDY